MMVPLLIFAASADLDALGQAVDRCDRRAANPAFAAESGRRSQFLLDAFREQETIVAGRSSIADRRRLLRETSGKKSAEEERSIAIEEQQVEDRQRALNDQRMLEGIRQDTMDAMRRHYLTHCAAGNDKSSKNAAN